jgi:hypothetical protein
MLQKCASLGVNRTADKIVGGRIAYVEFNSLVELYKFYQIYL